MSNPTGIGGFQERKQHINRNGRPKSFDALRKLAQQISHEPIKDGASITAAEAILRKLALENPTRFLEIAYGKVPDRQENINIDVSKLDDEQLERLAKGDDLRSIITTKSAGGTRKATQGTDSGGQAAAA